MKSNMKKFLKGAGMFALCMGSHLAFAAQVGGDLAGITQGLAGPGGELSNIPSLLSDVSYIAGIGFGIKAALSLKEHNETKGQVKLSTPITLAVVAAMLIGLPSLLSSSTTTIFGAGGTNASMNSTMNAVGNSAP